MSKRQQDRRARRAQDVAQSATDSAALAAGHAAARAAEALQRAGAAVEQHGRASAPAVGGAVGSAVDTAVDGAGTARAAAGRWGGAAAGVAGGLAGAVQGLAHEPGVRGAAALEALRGVPVSPPAARRRWPWAVVAALAGALAGAAVAAGMKRLAGSDAPGAQEPHELRAVVDVAPEGAAPRPVDDPAPRTPASPA